MPPRLCGRTPAEAVANYGSRYRECGLFLTAQAGDMNLERAVALGEIDLLKRLFLLASGSDPSVGSRFIRRRVCCWRTGQPLNGSTNGINRRRSIGRNSKGRKRWRRSCGFC